MADYIRAEAIIGHGKKLSWADTLAGTYTKLAGIKEVNLPERELGTAEITNDDTADFHKDYQPALFEPGTIDLTYTYSDTAFAALETIFQLANTATTRAAATKFWKYELPDGAIATFKGFLTKNNVPAAGQEDTVECEASIQVIGKMAFAMGV